MTKTRQLHKLRPRQVAALTRPGRHGDGGGLYLSISKTSAKHWVFLFMIAGRQREAGLGSVLTTSLAVAREKAAEFRAMLGKGLDPLDVAAGARRIAKTRKSFKEVAEMLVKSKRSGWRSVIHAKQWVSTLAEPCRSLHDRDVAEIDTTAVLAVLQPIWTTKPETASRLRGRIEAVLNFAKARGWRSGENPAAWRGHLETILPRRQAFSRGHYAAMLYIAVPDFVAELRTIDTVSARALLLIILCASRLDEVRTATLGEFDLPGAIWTIPAERMKAGLPHRVPLSAVAIEIIVRGVPRERGFVFPGRNPHRPISATAIQNLVPKPGATIHGFRSSFSDWAHDKTSFAHDVIESSLAHQTGTAVSRAYRRGDALEQRRALMDAWADFLFS
jgi:integrase